MRRALAQGHAECLGTPSLGRGQAQAGTHMTLHLHMQWPMTHAMLASAAHAQLRQMLDRWRACRSAAMLRHLASCSEGSQHALQGAPDSEKIAALPKHMTMDRLHSQIGPRRLVYACLLAAVWNACVKSYSGALRRFAAVDVSASVCVYM